MTGGIVILILKELKITNVIMANKKIKNFQKLNNYQII